MDGKVLSLEEILALAELPAKDVLQAQALGMMLAPITSLAIVLKAIAEKGGEAALLPRRPPPPLRKPLPPSKSAYLSPLPGGEKKFRF